MNRLEDNGMENTPDRKGQGIGVLSAIASQIRDFRDVFLEAWCDEIGPFRVEREARVIANLRALGWCQVRPSHVLTINDHAEDLHQGGHDTKILTLNNGTRVIYFK